MINRIVNKFLHTIYLIFAWFCAQYLSIILKSPKGTNSKKRILALPFYPENYAGGHERIGDWKDSVENLNIDYDVHWSYEEKYYKENMLSSSPFKHYKLYFKVTIDRVRIAKTFYKYDAVWIQRGFIPLFPFKKSLFEKQLRKHGNIIYDFYDADYESNFDLVVDTIKYGNKITVASEFLKDFCSKYNDKSYYLPFSFNYNKYPLKKYKDLETITLGWAGSPANFENIKKIAPHLVKLEQENENVQFLFICREKAELGLKRISYKSWGDEGFDYFETLMKIDIGLNPMLKSNDRTKAKVSFKCLEYMSMGLAFATSSFGIPKGLKHNENCIFVEDESMWFDKLNELIKSQNEIKSLGENARKLIEQDFDYVKNASSLTQILLEK